MIAMRSNVPFGAAGLIVGQCLGCAVHEITCVGRASSVMSAPDDFLVALQCLAGPPTAWRTGEGGLVLARLRAPAGALRRQAELLKHEVESASGGFARSRVLPAPSTRGCAQYAHPAFGPAAGSQGA